MTELSDSESKVLAKLDHPISCLWRYKGNKTLRWFHAGRKAAPRNFDLIMSMVAKGLLVEVERDSFIQYKKPEID